MFLSNVLDVCACECDLHIIFIHQYRPPLLMEGRQLLGHKRLQDEGQNELHLHCTQHQQKRLLLWAEVKGRDQEAEAQEAGGQVPGVEQQNVAVVVLDEICTLAITCATST